MEFEAALAQEALGVFGRTGLTPSQLADGLTECKEVRQDWVDEYAKTREALRGMLELVLAIQENNPALFIPSLNYNQRVMAAKDALADKTAGGK